MSPDFNHVDEHEDDREMNCDRNDDDGHFQDNMLTGKFVLSLEAGHKVSTTAVDSIVVFNWIINFRFVTKFVKKSSVNSRNTCISGKYTRCILRA